MRDSAQPANDQVLEEIPFGRAVKQLRKELGFTSQQAFASYLGVAVRTVAGWEAGRIPHAGTLKRLAELAAQTGLEDVHAAIWTAGAAKDLGIVSAARLTPQTALEESLVFLLLFGLRRPEYKELVTPVIAAMEPLLDRWLEHHKKFDRFLMVNWWPGAKRRAMESTLKAQAEQRKSDWEPREP